MKRFAALALVSTAVLHTPRALADEGQGDEVASARFTTHSATIPIESSVCHLARAAFVSGRTYALDIRLDDRRCSSQPQTDDALPVRVTLEALDGGLNGVTVEADVPEGEHAAEDARVIVKHVAGELHERIDGVQQTSERPSVRETPPAEETKRKHMASPGLFAFGIASVAVGSGTMVGGALVGLGSLFMAGACGLGHLFTGGGASCSPQGGLTAAGVMLGGGAFLAITGAISMSIGGRKVDRVSAYVTPTGGGLRVAF